MLFSSFYYLIAFLLWLLFIPYLLCKSRTKRYKNSVLARFFLKNNPHFEKELIHFHACSLGEVKALKPIIEKLDEDVNITTTTNTGFEEAKKLCKSPKFLPFEIFLPFWYKKQKILVVLEAELWYMLFLVAKRKNTKTILLNARMSDKSYKNYKRFKFFYKKIFALIDMVFAQTDKDKKRLIELGAKNVKVTGNIKVFQNIKKTKKLQKTKKPLLTIASSHKNEEKLLLKNLELENFQVAVVPRHPERFEKVYKFLNEFCQKRGLTLSRYSISKNFESDITLVDIIGELINIYAISDTVLLAGSFVDGIGGHNPLEPAYFGCKIVSGNYIFNQKALYKVVQNIEICKDIKKLNLHIKNAKRSYYNKEIDFKPILNLLKKYDINTTYTGYRFSSIV